MHICSNVSRSRVKPDPFICQKWRARVSRGLRSHLWFLLITCAHRTGSLAGSGVHHYHSFKLLWITFDTVRCTLLPAKVWYWYPPVQQQCYVAGRKRVPLPIYNGKSRIKTLLCEYNTATCQIDKFRPFRVPHVSFIIFPEWNGPEGTTMTQHDTDRQRAREPSPLMDDCDGRRKVGDQWKFLCAVNRFPDKDSAQESPQQNPAIIPLG